jgi:hypothetical protein
MKKSIIIFVDAATFLTRRIKAQAGTPVDEHEIPFGNGVPSGHHYNMNIPDKQGHFTCPPPEYVDGTRVYGKVVFIPRVQCNDPVRGEVSLCY